MVYLKLQLAAKVCPSLLKRVIKFALDGRACMRPNFGYDLLTSHTYPQPEDDAYSQEVPAATACAGQSVFALETHPAV
jgi:hypothetical protein